MFSYFVWLRLHFILFVAFLHCCYGACSLSIDTPRVCKFYTAVLDLHVLFKRLAFFYFEFIVNDFTHVLK
jgi:hypothetical protein